MSWCHDSRDEIPTLNVSRVVRFIVEILGRSDIPHDLPNVRINTVSTISQRTEKLQRQSLSPTSPPFNATLLATRNQGLI